GGFGHMAVCPSCGGHIDREASFCPHCGHHLS
ncbi:MAG: zinc-ribbon domain-containing protein, partial [Deltaproteobacteria bacterium]|nr:zinc-ribbon domain-containing protein [Deltaproteobacteria bacterium]